MEDLGISRDEVSMPNGFYERDTDSDEIILEIDKESPFRILKGVEYEYIEPHLFEKRDLYENNLFILYVVNDKVIEISQRYVPSPLPAYNHKNNSAESLASFHTGPQASAEFFILESEIRAALKIQSIRCLRLLYIDSK